MALISIDLDGVFADFLQGQHDAHGIPYDIAQYPYPPGLWDMFSYEGCEIVWATADKHSHEAFWAGLPWMYDGKQMWDAIGDQINNGDAQILTCPMMNEGSGSGKLRWVRQNIKCMYTRTTVSKVPKYESVGKDRQRLLIDDADKNVDQWRCAGGHAILVPRPWNSNHDVPLTMAVEYVSEKLKEWKRLVGYDPGKDNG